VNATHIPRPENKDETASNKPSNLSVSAVKVSEPTFGARKRPGKMLNQSIPTSRTALAPREVVVTRQLWKLQSPRGITAVCTLFLPEQRSLPLTWTVVVTWNYKPVSRERFSRLSDAMLSADRAREKLRRRDWVAVEEPE